MHHAESGPDGAIVAGGMLSLNLVTSSSSKKRKKQKRLFSDFHAVSRPALGHEARARVRDPREASFASDRLNRVRASSQCVNQALTGIAMDQRDSRGLEQTEPGDRLPVRGFRFRRRHRRQQRLRCQRYLVRSRLTGAGLLV